MLFKETVEPITLGILKDLMQVPALNDFALVGGTIIRQETSTVIKKIIHNSYFII